jgi:predicted TIM-barrel fold metal-dependent hydrolase
MEYGRVFGRRAMWWLVLSGVFERHPKLRLVITENPGEWWTDTLSEMDSVAEQNAGIPERLSKKPSEYCHQNVFVGASFISHNEALAACRDGYSENYLWGSDYPHIEGTWVYPNTSDEPPATHLALRFAFSEIPPDRAMAILGTNAANVYGLDVPKLHQVAARINAPSLNDFDVPFDQVMAEIRQVPKDRLGKFAFRTHHWV